MNSKNFGDIVANVLKYHAMCHVICRWRFNTHTSTPVIKACHQYTCNKVIEEVLAMIHEDISAGRHVSPEGYIRGNTSTNETLWKRRRRKSHNTEGYISRKVYSRERRNMIQA